MSLATPADWPKYVASPAPEHAQELLDAASANIVDYCEWPIARTAVTGEVYDGPGGRVLSLLAMRLVSVEAVRVDGAAVTGFRTSPRYAQLQCTAGVWPEGFGRIEVDYTAGFDPVPASLVKLCVQLAARGVSVPLAMASETVDRRTVRFREAAAVTGFDAWSLERYRLGARP